MSDYFSGKKIAWVIPGIIEGSGGLRTILGHMDALRQAGAQCDLHVADGGSGRDNAVLIKEKLLRFYGCTGYDVYSFPQLDESYDVAIATMWSTVRLVAEAPCRNKAYFVQDFEPWFYPMGDSFLAAVQSYRSGLPAITIGQWLTHKLGIEFGLPALPYDFTADKSVYTHLGIARENAICVLYQPDKPRRCSEMIGEFISIMRMVAPELTIYVYGSDNSLGMRDSHIVERGVIPVDECARLYNTCLAGICISSSNPSRIPFEMMACGLPVVDIYGENTLYDYCEEAVLLCEPSSAALATAILSIVGDEARGKAMGRAGIEFMSGRNKGDEEQDFVELLEHSLKCDHIGIVPPMPTYERPACSANEETRAAQHTYQKSVREASRLVELTTRRAKITIEGVEANRGVTDIMGGVWCAADQSDIHWYTAREETPDRYSFILDTANHDSHSGLYHVHVYLKRADGSQRIAAVKDCLISLDTDDASPGEQAAQRQTLSQGARVVPLHISIAPLSESVDEVILAVSSEAPKETRSTKSKGIIGMIWKKRG